MSNLITVINKAFNLYSYNNIYCKWEGVCIVVVHFFPKFSNFEFSIIAHKLDGFCSL